MTIICVQQKFDMRHDDAVNGCSKKQYDTYYCIERLILIDG